MYGGDALGRAEGRVIMAPLALPGELVRIEVESEKPQLVRARVAEVLEPSPERIAPKCPHFGKCGGCHYQHAGYEYQVAQKMEILREVLRRMAQIELAEGDVRAVTAEPWAYRNRIQLHFADRLMGFHAAGSHDIEAILGCDVASPRLAETIKALRELKRSPRWPRFIRSLELFTNETDVQVNVLDSGPQRVNRGFFEWMGATAMPGALAPALEYAAGEFNFRVSHKSFFQINRLLVEPLVEAALEGAEGGKALDLYAGVGLFSLPLSRRFKKVTAVEAVTSASNDLIFNAERHGCRIDTVKSRTEDYLESLDAAPDFVLADPPRTGLAKEAVEALVRLAPARIHMVSCDPPTLARDLKILAAGGYRVESVAMVDLFPQTSHIESVTRLVRA